MDKMNRVEQNFLSNIIIHLKLIRCKIKQDNKNYKHL